MIVLRISLYCLLTIFATHADAALFKCTGPSGAIAFTDKPCVGDKQEAIEQKYKVGKVDVPSTGTARPPTDAKSQELPKKKLGIDEAKSELPKAEEISLEDRLASKCVDVYRAHLAYPKGVVVEGRKLERSLSEMLMTVSVKTITNPATPIRIDPIFLHEKFICVTDFKDGLNSRSTSIYVDRHKRGERLN